MPRSVVDHIEGPRLRKVEASRLPTVGSSLQIGPKLRKVSLRGRDAMRLGHAALVGRAGAADDGGDAS